MAVVERVSHRIAVMYLGQIVETGTRRNVFENPGHAYTQRLMDAAPIPDPSLRIEQRPLITGEVPSPVRAINNPPTRLPLREISPDHFITAE